MKFICLCGKEYKNKNALQAHQNHHCIKCLGEERYNKEKAHCRKMSEKSKLNRDKRKLEAAIQQKNAWLKEKHFCERCGKLMLEKFGSGRFCSRFCSNSRNHTPEVKLKISNSLKSSSKFIDGLLKTRPNRYARNGYYKGIFCGSTWELAFLVYCIDHKIPIIRCKETFKYEYNEQSHSYLPDFYLTSAKQYIEIKGKNQFYNKEIINAKMQAVVDIGLNYEIIDDSKITKYIDYCKDTYNTNDISSLYDHREIKVKPDKSDLTLFGLHGGSRKPKTAGYRWMYNELSKHLTLVSPENWDKYKTLGYKFKYAK